MSAPTTWTPVAEKLPDADMLVIVATDDAEVYPGFLDGDTWRDATGWPITGHTVTHWMDFPAAPTLEPADANAA